VKWVFLISSVAAVPPLSTWLRRNPGYTLKVWMLVGFLPFVVDNFHLYMAIDSWAYWGGYVKGAEISVVDILALALYFTLPFARNPLPFRFLMLSYFVAAALSALRAQEPTAALFYSWQLGRMFFVYAVVAKACAADMRVAPALMRGMAVGLFIQAAVAIWQRFGLGILQTGGTIGHQNLLGLISHLVIFPFFALFLSGISGIMAPAVVLAGVIIEVLTISRATIGLAGFAYTAVFLTCGRLSSRKAVILVIAALSVAALAPLVLSSFERRELTNDFASSDDERTAYTKAAQMMVTDHPLGVGANHFAPAAYSGGYDDAAEVPLDNSARAGNVHNTYLLIAAETGYPGVITFVLLLFGTLLVAFRCGWSHRREQSGVLLLGFGVALLTVYIHAFFEWSLVTFEAQYMVVTAMGIVAGTAQQLGYWHPAPSSSVSFAATSQVRD
jgi:O-antigen ligase